MLAALFLFTIYLVPFLNFCWKLNDIMPIHMIDRATFEWLCLYTAELYMVGPEQNYRNSIN